MTGMVTACWMPSISAGSLIRATPPWARMSAGTRSRAMTATAPASSAILACSALTTSMITPPRSMSARPALDRERPGPALACPLWRAVPGSGAWASSMAGSLPPAWPVPPAPAHHSSRAAIRDRGGVELADAPSSPGRRTVGPGQGDGPQPRGSRAPAPRRRAASAGRGPGPRPWRPARRGARAGSGSRARRGVGAELPAAPGPAVARGRRPTRVSRRQREEHGRRHGRPERCRRT